MILAGLVWNLVTDLTKDGNVFNHNSNLMRTDMFLYSNQVAKGKNVLHIDLHAYMHVYKLAAHHCINLCIHMYTVHYVLYPGKLYDQVEDVSENKINKSNILEFRKLFSMQSYPSLIKKILYIFTEGRMFHPGFLL